MSRKTLLDSRPKNIKGFHKPLGEFENGTEVYSYENYEVKKI